MTTSLGQFDDSSWPFYPGITTSPNDRLFRYSKPATQMLTSLCEICLPHALVKPSFPKRTDNKAGRP
jgi:hypothetical protein